MKKLLAIFLIILIPGFSLAEDSPYPFGIQQNASQNDVAAVLQPVFGDIITVPGFEEKTWAIHPENKFLYDYEIEDIQMYIKGEAWQLEFRLHEILPDSFPVHLSALYASIVDLYGPVISTKPEIYTYDINGSQLLNVVLEDPEKTDYFFSQEGDVISYFCRWELCSLYASISHSNGNTYYIVNLSWYKE